MKLDFYAHTALDIANNILVFPKRMHDALHRCQICLEQRGEKCVHIGAFLKLFVLPIIARIIVPTPKNVRTHRLLDLCGRDFVPIVIFDDLSHSLDSF